jgi:hypothetical protein
MGLLKDQTNQIILISLIFVGIVVYCLTLPTDTKEGFQASFSIPPDAENLNLTNEQVFGLIPAAASASIFKKKEARDRVANLNSLSFNKAEGKYSFEATNVELNKDPNDIEEVLSRKQSIEGFATVQELAAQAAQDKLEGAVQEKVQDKILKTKGADKLASTVVKNLVKVNTTISTKLGNRVGAGVAKKLAEKASLKIAELVGRRAATATAIGITQTALPDPTGISQFFGIVLTLFGAVGLTAQVVISTVLKGEDGFCPTGYERLNGAIPSFLTKIPGIGDILEVMGSYVCFRNACDANEDEDAGLCYNKCDKGYKGVGPVCWANSNDVGVGQLKECPPGWTNDGLTCRQPISCDPLRWDGCCNRTWPGICWGCLRGGACRGGTVKGRAAGSDLPCPSSHPNQITGLCYKGCPTDTPNRVAGMPYLCSAASSVGDGRGKTSYGRGVGRPKLKLKAVEKDPTPQPPPPAVNSSAAFAEDPNTTCKADFTSRIMLTQMSKFYYSSASKVPRVVSNGLQITYMSRISKVIASGEQSCDILCDLTTITLGNATSKTPLASTTVRDKTRRFYFAKLVPVCKFVVTASTNIDDTGKELANPDVSAISVNFAYNPFV